MIVTTEDFGNGCAAECYEHFVELINPENYFKMPYVLQKNIGIAAHSTIDFAYAITHGGIYILYGVCSDLYDKLIAIAVADNLEELMVFADLQGMHISKK